MKKLNIASKMLTRLSAVPLLLMVIAAAGVTFTALACEDERVPPPPRATPTRALSAPVPPPTTTPIPTATPQPLVVDSNSQSSSTSEDSAIRSRRYEQPGFIGISTDDVVPFTNIAEEALGDYASVANDLTGVAIFDYDRDGDMDFYITQSRGNPNLLFRNDGGEKFTEVGVQAGVSANASNSTGAVACDIDNNGYQDIYVSAQGIIGDGLDYADAHQ